MKMKKTAMIFFLVSFFAIITGCASLIIPVPGESFYNAKISTIHIYSTLFYEPRGDKVRIDKFEKKVIEILKSKGYQAYVEPRVNYGSEIAGLIATRLIPNSKADSVMIMDTPFYKLQKYSDPAHKFTVGEEVYSMSSSFWLYNRNGDRILTTPKGMFGVVFMRRANTKFAPPGGRNIYENVIFYESEDELIHRVAKRLTDNIPNRN